MADLAQDISDFERYLRALDPGELDPEALQALRGLYEQLKRWLEDA